MARIQAFVEELKGLPIAIETDRANEQHYEVGPATGHQLRSATQSGRHITAR